MTQQDTQPPAETLAKDTRLWCMHVSGMDEVHPAPDRATAQRWVAKWTADFARRVPDPGPFDPVMNFTVQEWPHSAASHAAGLADSIIGNTWPIDPLGGDAFEAIITLDVFLAAYARRSDDMPVYLDRDDDNLLRWGHLRTILAALTRRAGGEAVPRKVLETIATTLPIGATDAGKNRRAGGDAIPAGEDARIILISDDHGCQTHGLFTSFDDALAHAKKDGAHEAARWTMTSPDRGCFLDGATFWTASREPVRATPKPPAGGDAGAVERLARIRTSMALLQQNSEGCALNHYGDDAEAHGLPGWLADTRADLDAFADILAALALPAPVVEGDSPYVAGPIWAEEEDDCFTAEIQISGGHYVVATVHGATRDEVEQRQWAIIAALSEGRSHG